mmetsp:Transcript_43343/g.114654  ORF Transcript_43343/g.114654 Transcript_43343/m.114654 type:complete len:938 (+) Transcript_43343:82-2895(+)
METRLRNGQLVQISGLPGPVETETGPKDVNGQMGQVTEFDSETGSWKVATFGAALVAVGQGNLRPLSAEELQDLDVVLGPASDPEVMGSEITDSLKQKGHAICKVFMSPEDMESMCSTADRCVAEGAFSRLSSELEPGYLGVEGTGKILAVELEDPDTAHFVRTSSLSLAEDALASIGPILRPFTSEHFGFDIFSRSTTMMSLPLGPDDDAAYSPPDLENEDASNFLSMMWRAKLMAILNAGPSNATLTLISKKTGAFERVVTVKPGTIAIFQVDRFRFSYRPEGKALTLQTFYLTEPREYALDQITGDITGLTSGVSGAPPPRGENVSVVSMATRYAFGCDEPWKLWVAYSKAAFDVMTRHPITRWDCDFYYEPDADQTSGKSYTCHGGFSDGIELFDCRFFDISPAEARGMDPTQRQVLEVSYIALQGAGYNKRMLQQKPQNIAAFVGLDKNEWAGIPKDNQGSFGASNNANAITSNRFNYCMNLKGASMTIDTACSSSLVAQHTGKLYLLYKHFEPCEAVITCGVNLSMSPMSYIGCCGAGMHSHKGRCFTYNFSADGYARGEATAASGIKLKPWDRESGDYALIAGSQANQDGRSASLTAPNGPAQERCARTALKEAQISPPELDTTECHGTGTSLGDPIEIGAYRKVMAQHERSEPVVITSNKSNLGHCEGSAGIGGFLKCVLLCMYSEGTPNVHLSMLNPHLDMDGFPGIILTEGVVLRAEASYNNVLSFGFGGTNACAALYGSNLMTSRCMAQQDTYGMVLRKMQDAPPQEVTITGDDWEDWVVDFPVRHPNPADQWDINIDADGVVNYSRQDRKDKDLGSSYYIVGTFNDYDKEPLFADDQLPGLHTATVLIGATGQEEFQILADKDPNMIFYPATQKCVMKGGPILGPGEATQDDVWCIRGAEGDQFRVEFYRSEAGTVSLTWIKENV